MARVLWNGQNGVSRSDFADDITIPWCSGQRWSQFGDGTGHHFSCGREAQESQCPSPEGDLSAYPWSATTAFAFFWSAGRNVYPSVTPLWFVALPYVLQSRLQGYVDQQIADNDYLQANQIRDTYASVYFEEDDYGQAARILEVIRTDGQRWSITSSVFFWKTEPLSIFVGLAYWIFL